MFESCSCSELLEAHRAIDDTLAIIFKIDSSKKIKSATSRLEKMTKSAWKVAAKNGLTTALEVFVVQGKQTKKAVTEFLGALGITLKTPLTAGQAKIIGKQLEVIMHEAKKVASQATKFKLSFGMADARAAAAVNRHNVYWVGDFYSSHLADRIAAVTNDVVTASGLGYEEAGRELKQAVGKELGIVPGGKSTWAETVPARYSGEDGVDLYFKQLSSTVAKQASTIGKLKNYEEAGVKSYELLNPNDERTGRICRELVGQIITMEAASGQVDQFLEATDPEDVKSFAEWRNGSELATLLGGASRGSEEATSNLIDGGALLFPPFHPSCRTEAVPIM